MTPPVLQVQQLHVTAGDQSIVRDVTFDLSRGELTTIIGPSGSGKSTILRAINRLADKESGLQVSGSIRYKGCDVFRCCPVNELRRDISLVFQKPCIFPGSIRRNVLFGVRHHQPMSRTRQNDLIEKVLRQAHLFKEVKDRLNKPAHLLSIGQKQRLAFARSLAVNPAVILLDEPTSSLDPHSTIEIEKALRELKSTCSILLVTHSLEQGRRISDRVIFMSNSQGFGTIVEQGAVEQIFENPQHPDTQQYVLNR